MRLNKITNSIRLVGLSTTLTASIATSAATIDYTNVDTGGAVNDYTSTVSLSTSTNFTIDWGTGLQGSNVYTDEKVYAANAAMLPFDTASNIAFNASTGGFQLSATNNFSLDSMYLGRRSTGSTSDNVFTITGYRSGSAVITDDLTWSVFSGGSAETFTRGSGTWSDDVEWQNIDTLVVTWATTSDGSGGVVGTTDFEEIAVLSMVVTNPVASDSTPPIISEVTPVTTPTNDNTPNYTFTTDEAGTLSVGGSCGTSTSTTIGGTGNQTITLTQTDNSTALADGTYSNCTITVTDAANNPSSVLNITSFTVDTTAPAVAEVTAVTTPGSDSTPSYTFSTTETGTLSVGGSCGTSSSTTISSTGNQTITLTQTDNSTALVDGTYSNCTITITDAAGNANTPLSITAFTIDSIGPAFDGANSTPNDDATGVAGNANIVVDFNENISLGTGNITIRDVSSNSDFEVFNVATESDGTTTSPSAGRIGITNDKIYINPSNNLTGNRNYAIRIDATAVDDSAGNSFPGINDDTSFNFSTGNTAPAVDLDSTSGSDDSSVSFSEGAGAVNIAANAAVTETDGDTITTITVSLTNDQDGVSEGLNISASAQDALTGVSGSSDITLQDTISITGATASAAEVQTFLQAITYNNTSSSPNQTSRTVTVVINDGTNNSTSRTATISVSNLTAASSTAASFNTTNGTNLSPAITFTSDDETLTIADPSHIVGSIADGGAGTDTLSVATGSNLANFTTLTNFETLTPETDGSLTLTETQHDAFTTINGSGTNQFTISSADGDQTLIGDSDIESYVLGAAMSFTLASSAQSVTGSTGVDTIDVAGFTTTGTLAGGAGTDTLRADTGANISGATLSSFESLTLSDNASVTMTEAQHDNFTTITAAGTESITISDSSDGLTGNSAVETYILSAVNTFTLGHAAQNLTGSSGDDTVNVGTLNATGTLAGGSGTDTLILSNSGNIAGATVSGFENLSVAENGSATISVAQLSSFTGTVSGSGSESLTLSGDGDITTISAIESYTLSDDSTNARTVTVSNTNHSVTATSTSDAVTFDLGSLTYTGTITGDNTTADTLSLGSGADITAATINGVSNLTIESGANVAMTVSQHQNFNGTLTASGSETITLSGDGDITALTGIENYLIGDDSSNTRTITILSGTTSVTANSTSDAITFAIGGSAYSGILTGDSSVADNLLVTDGADVSGGVFNSIGTLSLASGASVAVDAENLNDFTTGITGSTGIETLNLMDGGTFDFATTNVTGIEGISIGTNNVATINLTDNFNADTQTVSVTNTTGSAITADLVIDASAFVGDVLEITAADLDGSDTMIGGSGADTIRPGEGADTITGNGGSDNFIGESSDLNGDTLTDLSIGDVITITGMTGLSTSNVRFNGSSILEIDTNATDFSSPEISLSLTNAPASDLVYTVADSGSDTVITFGSSNSGPVFSGLNGGSTFTEGGSAIVIDANVTVADSELDALNSGNGNYDGASVTIARAGGANGNDLFTNTGLLGVLTQGGALSYNSNVVGTVTTNSAGTLQLTFNSNATSVLVDSVLQAIGYINNANNPASTVTLNYTFNDGLIDSTGTNQAIVTIVPPSVPSNNAPVISGQPITSIDEDTLYSFTPSATDSDGDSLEFSITNLPLWARFDNTTGTISGTPIEGQSGSYDNIVITVSDGELESALPAFNIIVNPVNDAPVIFGVPPIEVKQGENYSFTPTVEDVDSDTFSFFVSNLPAWLSFDTSTGRLSGTPDITDVGNYENIVISVSDGSLQASLEGFSILVTATNAAPVANDMQRNVQEDGTTSFVADVQDANDDSLVIELISQPENGNVQVQGTIFTYTPSPNFNGNDTFTYRVSDGQLSSNDASVVINVSAVNDVPVANDDNFNFAAVSDNQYTLSVLENDTDADGDALRIIGAKASIGTVSINNNTLSYQAIENTQGPILVNYIIEDENKARAKATATIAINSDDSSGVPVITAPADLTVNATGLFTKVDLGIAMAFDNLGNPLPVSLVRGAPIFAPGKHLVYWQTEDNEGQQVTTTQQLNVNPLVSLQKDSRVAEDKEHAVKVYLNGPAPSYPVVIPYTVSGTADSADHDLQSGELVISAGVSASIPLMIFADSSDEGNETIVITLGDSVNKGAKSTSTVTIVEDNVAPNIETLVLQNNQQRSTITASGELVTITANVSDPNPTDEVTVEWDAAPEFVNTSNDPFIFEFNPAAVASGIYKVRVTAKDNAVPSLSTMKDVYIEVIPSLPELTAVDRDGDLIPDDQEGYVDSDSDGIPDFMDAISDCNVMQEQALESSQFLVEGDPGVCLRKGATVPQNNTGGLQLLETELPEDPTASNTGGLFDFIATGLPEVGDTYSIVLPQRQPIPVNAVYRKLINGDWQNFVIVDGNEVLSTQGEPGFCPPPGSNEWTTGLSEGDWCVQLRIVDGGPNDDDGVANGSIVDPGGVAVPTTGNNAPIANADAVTIMAEESVVIDVIANDEDIDNDTLTITGATVDFGTVVIENNRLVYTPIVGYIGDATIQYSITDGMGGTANSTAIVTIKVNQAPVTQNDSASSNGETITIDVLANDSDPEQGELFLVSATTEFGTSVVNSDGTLSYTPAAGFEGMDTINYIVKDAQGAQSQGSVSVTVELKQTVNVSNKSSGGGLGMITLLVVSAFVVRRRVSRLPSFALLSTSCVLASSAAAEDWQVSATLGQATAQSSYSSEQWVQTAIDDESVSWSVGAFYNLKPNWKLGIRYIDLGEASVNFSKETSNPEQAHSELSDKAPALPTGLAIQANYLVDLASSLKGELFLGAYHWKYKINSRRDNSNTIVKRDEGTDLFLGAGINYQLLDSVSIGVDYTRYFVSENDINEIALSMSYQF